MGYLQQFHLINKYKKSSANKIVDMLSIPSTLKSTPLGILVHMETFTHEAYKEE